MLESLVLAILVACQAAGPASIEMKNSVEDVTFHNGPIERLS